jgi:hypothetical protein
MMNEESALDPIEQDILDIFLRTKIETGEGVDYDYLCILWRTKTSHNMEALYNGLDALKERGLIANDENKQNMLILI